MNRLVNVREVLPSILLAVFLALAPGMLTAQTTGVVQGRVISTEDRQPLGAASVVVRAVADSSIIGGGAADASGTFRITGLVPGRYIVEATFLGRTPATETVQIAAGQTADVGALTLTVAAIALEGVAVRTERAPAAFAADRTVYGTADMPAAQGGTATEVLATIPELEVDIDGSVGLRGSSPQIYLNGRPAPMEGEALNVFLEQFPADRIERIEVIPNPSARFDSEGAGGIVNIVLKEDVELGLSGSAFANVRTRGEAGGGGRVSWQKGDLTLFGGAFVRRTDRENESFDLRQNLLVDPTTYLQRESDSWRGGWSGSVDGSAELVLGGRSILHAQARLSDFGSDSDGTTTTTHLDDVEQPTQRYDRISESGSTRLSADVTLGFQHEFEEPGHELGLELEIERGRNDQERHTETSFELFDEDATFIPADLTLEDSDNRDRQIGLDADYVLPWGEDGRVEVGYRGSLQRQSNNRLLRDFEGTAASDPVAVERDGFAHDEMFNSLYATLLRGFGNFGVQLGLRAERADTKLELPSGESFDNDYFSLFPSGNISYELGEGKQLRLSYSRRIRRPSPGILNPTDRSDDPLYRRVGNPGIEPQYTHSLSLDASASTSWGNIRLSPYYRRVTNDWAEIQTVDEASIATTTWKNIATTENYGASLTASLRRTGGWGGFASFSTHQEVRDASNLETDYSGSSLRWSARANASGNLTSTLSMRATASYSPAREVPQGRRSARFMTHLGFRQRLMDGRASINLTVTDPFDLYDSTFQSRDLTYLQIGRNEERMRAATVSFSYSFGGAQADEDRDERGGGFGHR